MSCAIDLSMFAPVATSLHLSELITALQKSAGGRWIDEKKLGGIDKKKANFMEGVAERCLRVSHECHMRSSDLEGLKEDWRGD